MRIFSYSILLFLFWLLLSGHFEPLLLGLGLASVALTIFLVHRMEVVDHESYPLHLSKQLPKFIVYLFKEILLSNIDVVKRVLSPRRPSISPKLFEVPLPQKSILGQVIYANSITLTPGTVSIQLTENKILVHALSKEAADALADGSMAKQIPDKVVKS
ncbi:MAG: Na+/H+ antiporter subunit E [Gammaproteobacteria bacterium]|nr:Na+/H+ antiporter subunit E [Gammaproteobacteria bacterium]